MSYSKVVSSTLGLWLLAWSPTVLAGPLTPSSLSTARTSGAPEPLGASDGEFEDPTAPLILSAAADLRLENLDSGSPIVPQVNGRYYDRFSQVSAYSVNFSLRAPLMTGTLAEIRDRVLSDGMVFDLTAAVDLRTKGTGAGKPGAMVSAYGSIAYATGANVEADENYFALPIVPGLRTAVWAGPVIVGGRVSWNFDALRSELGRELRGLDGQVFLSLTTSSKESTDPVYVQLVWSPRVSDPLTAVSINIEKVFDLPF